jgi:hypothetical protein
VLRDAERELGSSLADERTAPYVIDPLLNHDAGASLVEHANVNYVFVVRGAVKDPAARGCGALDVGAAAGSWLLSRWFAGSPYATLPGTGHVPGWYAQGGFSTRSAAGGRGHRLRMLRRRKRRAGGCSEKCQSTGEISG